MAKTKPKKKTTKKPATTPKPPNKLTKKTTKKTKKPKPKTSSDSDSDPLTLIQTLLNPFPKDHLVTLVIDLALSHPILSSLVESAADIDITHRKIFIHGLAWDATRLSIEPIFQSYGPIDDLNVVLDRSTGKCKGYAFLTFKTRKSAQKLLKNPRVMIGNRIASCQLASAGTPAPTPTPTPTPTPGGVGIGIVSQQHFPASSDYAQRKIYVNNVPVNANAGKLRALFEKFGEIESGPTGLDPDTGKFRGYALFVYRTVEGARRALEEPVKVFEGTQLVCRKAAEGKGKFGGGAASITTALQPVQPQMLAAVAQAQNMAMLGQGGFMNPLYGGGGMIGGGANLGAALMGGYYGMMGGQMEGLGLGGYGGSGAGYGGEAEGGFGSVLCFAA